MNLFLGLSGVIFCALICHYKEEIISWESVLIRKIFSFLAVICGIYVVFIGMYNIGDTFDFISSIFSDEEVVSREKVEINEVISDKNINEEGEKTNKAREIIDKITPKQWLILSGLAFIIAIFKYFWQPVVLLYGLGSIVVGVGIWKAVRAAEEFIRRPQSTATMPREGIDQKDLRVALQKAGFKKPPQEGG